MHPCEAPSRSALSADGAERRGTLGLGLAVLLAGNGLLPAPALAAWQSAGFDARTPAEVWRALGLSAPVDSPAVTLQAPEVAENGAAVALAVACSAPGVRRLALLVEKNPSPLCAVFDLAGGVAPTLATRAKMAESSPVWAVAVLADGRVLYTRREVQVTQGGCGG